MLDGRSKAVSLKGDVQSRLARLVTIRTNGEGQNFCSFTYRARPYSPLKNIGDIHTVNIMSHRSSNQLTPSVGTSLQIGQSHIELCPPSTLCVTVQARHLNGGSGNIRISPEGSHSILYPDKNAIARAIQHTLDTHQFRSQNTAAALRDNENSIIETLSKAINGTLGQGENGSLTTSFYVEGVSLSLIAWISPSKPPCTSGMYEPAWTDLPVVGTEWEEPKNHSGRSQCSLEVSISAVAQLKDRPSSVFKLRSNILKSYAKLLHEKVPLYLGTLEPRLSEAQVANALSRFAPAQTNAVMWTLDDTGVEALVRSSEASIKDHEGQASRKKQSAAHYKAAYNTKDLGVLVDGRFDIGEDEV